MKLSPQQIKYYAWDLSHRRSTADDNKFVGVLSEAKVDLNPHQIEAALFAFHSPFSKGVILADEVGLGKTIETGIILSQFWAEHKRRILIIVPASLRNQWNEELQKKFYLPSVILEKERYELTKAEGKDPLNPKETIIICSYQFFVNHENEFEHVMWDLVIMDEAHKLRNVYQKSNVIGNAVKKAFKPCKKLLLTATPLQNNLKELYGLVSIVDDNFFTSPNVFADRYNAVTIRDTARYGELRARLIKIIHRTLRKQVKEYVNYTKRTAILQSYIPSEKEQQLYDEINQYLLRKDTYGIPEKSRALLSLIVRKILGSSAYALSFTLYKFIMRLEQAKLTGYIQAGEENEHLEEEDDDVSFLDSDRIDIIDECKLDNEIEELKRFRHDALSIGTETKAKSLLEALQKGFERMRELGAQHKALVFTESTRTQEYLKTFLSENGYQGKVVCFNGTNNEEYAQRIYQQWLRNPQNTSKITGNSIIDRKQALVDEFKSDAEIMIATEAGAEGINLQFCSLVVNYDMPWNPQRVEQRIGRCHRYGQKFDVVVVNFVNERNQAERRIYELLRDKFNLFEGVFGSSDEVLGAIESGVDFEKRLNRIYQICRTSEEIQMAFDQLQSELEEEIRDKISQTKKTLIENFDEDVIDKLKVRKENDEGLINIFKRHFWYLALQALSADIVEKDDTSWSFTLKDGNTPAKYSLSQKEGDALPLLLDSDLGRKVLDFGRQIETKDVQLDFDLSNYRYRMSILEQQKGSRGTCVVYKVHSDNEFDGEEKVFFCSSTDKGEVLPNEFGEKLMELSCVAESPCVFEKDETAREYDLFQKRLSLYKEEAEMRSSEFVNDEIDKIQNWVDETLTPLEDEIRELDGLVRSVKASIRKERNAKNKIELMKQERILRSCLLEKRNKLGEEQKRFDKVADQKAEELTKSLENNITYEEFFRFRWRII